MRSRPDIPAKGSYAIGCAKPIAAANSITHQHIAAVINTLLGRSVPTNVVSVLDVGCGEGKLLEHALAVLSALRPDLQVEAFGLDVSDAGQQEPGYFQKTRRYLAARYPTVDWRHRLALITTQDRWPYPDESFDFIVSNQVMEHVSDHDFVFRQIRRCLREGGRECKPVSSPGSSMGGARMVDHGRQVHPEFWASLASRHLDVLA